MPLIIRIFIFILQLIWPSSSIVFTGMQISRFDDTAGTAELCLNKVGCLESIFDTLN
jgi:hypothetical protein